MSVERPVISFDIIYAFYIFMIDFMVFHKFMNSADETTLKELFLYALCTYIAVIMLEKSYASIRVARDLMDSKREMLEERILYVRSMCCYS